MKLLPLLLMNAVMVGGGIAIYDQLQDDDKTRVYQESSTLTSDQLARLDERYLGKGSTAEPMLRATGVDERVLARLAALEDKLSAESPSVAMDDAPDAPKPPLATSTSGDEVGEVTESELSRFRKLQERAEALRRTEREQQRLAGFLERLEIDLTDEQKEKLLATSRSYREKMGERMRAAFQAAADGGDRREAMREVFDGLRQEFTVEITEYVSVGDAQKISENLNQLVRGGFGGMRGGPPRGGGGGR